MLQPTTVESFDIGNDPQATYIDPWPYAPSTYPVIDYGTWGTTGIIASTASNPGVELKLDMPGSTPDERHRVVSELLKLVGELEGVSLRSVECKGD